MNGDVDDVVDEDNILVGAPLCAICDRRAGQEFQDVDFGRLTSCTGRLLR
jgi:hypothetical protein